MDRPTTRNDADTGAFPLPSRRGAIDRCRDRLSDGPILITGDAGIGKTWLWRRLEAEASPTHRWIAVDLTPTNEPNDLYRLIGHALGLDRSSASVETRIEIADHLADRRADGHRRSLVIEEAHNLSASLWEEIRVLANRLGQPEGFAAILIVGQTPLARRFSTRSLAAIEARIAARVHLGPIDADEALALLIHDRPEHPWDRLEAETLHRDSAGNPRRMLRIAGGSRLTTVESVFIAITAEPLTGPAKPPLLVEDNLIEVGWSPDEEEEDVDLEDFPDGSKNMPSLDGEEAVQDRYAALQAWDEWSKNQARLASATIDVDEDAEATMPREELTDIRADVEQSFAPFGQLFSKMAQDHGLTDRRPDRRSPQTPTSETR